MPEDLTVNQVKRWKQLVESSIVGNIGVYTNRTGDFPEITVERILVINEGRRSFKYEVKIK